IYLGGPQHAVDVCMPLLQAMAKEIFHLGAVGAGQVAKLTNNVMGIANRIVASESLALARAAGLDEDTMVNVVRVSVGSSWIIEHWYEMREHAKMHVGGPEASAMLARKDLQLALELAKELGCDMPLTAKASEFTEGMFGPGR